MKASKAKSHIGILKRICALVLCTAILIGIMPQVSFTKAEATNTTQTEALNKLVEWGIMRGDQAGNLSPNRAITRAEFVTMLNRTFGYTKTTSEPFKDVASSNWFYDDIRIAYKSGYFTGTSKTTASPNANLTREAAVVMLCRNIMLKEQSGEDLSFTDSRLASDWSRGFIKAAAEKGIVAGDTSGTFRPLANITRGEVAILLARIIGTPILDTGTYSNNVNGNLMINKSGVTLDNMTVSGDLYITGGVGLGYVTLNNVHVHGQIIASGAGESNKGDCSIIIKNSSAPEMIVDSPSNQYVTIRTAGSTVIDKTYVRTDTYLEDKSNEGYGMTYIQVDGEEGTKLDLSGNINEVVSTTPKSAINVGSGVVKKLTIDENATNSTVKIDQGAVVEILNLDVATTVTGKGDIASLYVNAPGCKVEMLPDYIYIRPGITANINGTEMDSTLAEQMSDKPRILTGYPRSDDIAPTQITAKFETNKEGTVYWAVRLSGDGAMVADDIIKPPSYGAKVVKSGKVSAKEANKVIESKVSGLKLDTSYVLSAVLVDERGTNSLVKTLYFTTPDNSKPNFASGYPKANLIEDTYVIFDVAASKNCTLYWAIYKKGMTAPIANDFKDNVLTGSIHSGTVKMTKSEEESVTMGNILENASNALREYTDYDVYFFLSDGVNDSTIKKVSVTTADRTPPEFLTNYPRISKIAAKALTGEAAINENGKIYWAIVKHGTDYPVPDPNLDPNNPSDQEKLQLYYKNQIKGGMYALKSGSVSTTKDAIKSINFSGLAAETAYDIYFVAEDSHGNLSEIKTINNAKTLDSSAPELLEQKFSLTNDKGDPLADTDITLVFDEDIYSNENRKSLYEMFNEIKSADDIVLTTTDKKTFSFQDLINRMFVLSDLNADPSNQTLKLDLGGINFRNYINIKLTEDGYTEVTFKNTALPLKSGGTYQFTLNYITDSSNNNMGQNIKVNKFTVLNAQININKLAVTTVPDDDPKPDTSYAQNGEVKANAAFSMIPYANSTASAADGITYDILIASDTSIEFEIYRRIRTDGTEQTGSWEKLKNKTTSVFKITNDAKNNKWTALSLNDAQGIDTGNYPQLNKEDPKTGFNPAGYDYAISIRSIDGDRKMETWNSTINLKIFCVAGESVDVDGLTPGDSVTDKDYNDYISNPTYGVSSIGNPADGLDIKVECRPNTPPQFLESYPLAAVGDSIANIEYMLDRDGTVYYVVVPVDVYKNNIKYGDGGSQPDAEVDIGNPPDDSPGVVDREPGVRNHNLISPSANSIMKQTGFTGKDYITDSSNFVTGGSSQKIELTNLKANTKYYIFFALRNEYVSELSLPLVYTFTTGDVVSPSLKAISTGGGSRAEYTIAPGEDANTVEANVYWNLYPYSGYPDIFKQTPQDLGYTDVDPSFLNKTVSELIKSGDINKITNSAFKNQVFDTIANSETGGYTITDSGDDTDLGVSATNSDPFKKTIINTDKLELNNRYILFVTAKNILGGDPVFSIVEQIRKYDTEPPKVDSISKPSNTSANDNYFTGTVFVTFNKDLHVINQDTFEAAKYPYIVKKDDIQSTASGTSKVEFGNSGTEAKSVLKLEFKYCLPDTTVYITPTYDGITTTGVFASKDAVGRKDSPIAFRLERVANEDGTTYSWQVVMASGDYIGSTSETNPTNQ